jgi:hypothetical protein
MKQTWQETEVADYGVELTVDGARHWRNATRAWSREIRTVGEYVARCRRIKYSDRDAGLPSSHEAFDPSHPITGQRMLLALAAGAPAAPHEASYYAPGLLAVDTGVDGRLIAVGFNSASPRQWMCEGGLRDFLAYWNEAVDRPSVIGSSCNSLDPEQVRWLQRAGVSAKLVRRCGSMLLPRDGNLRSCPRVGRRRSRKALAVTRASRRISYKYGGTACTNSLLKFLGQLSPEEQTVLITKMIKPLHVQRYSEYLAGERLYGTTKIRPADIDWSVASVLCREVRASIRTRLSLTRPGCKRALEIVRSSDPNFADVSWAWGDLLYPQYCNLPTEVVWELLCGATPASLARCTGLTDAEAHAYLQSDGQYSSSTHWLADRLGVLGLRDMNVMRWLSRIGRNPVQVAALGKTREWRGPGGLVSTGRYADMLDELDSSDIEGVCGVNRAFERMAVRQEESKRQEMLKRHERLALEPEMQLYRGMRWLMTPHDLAVEGQEMHHCVGGYGEFIRQGRSLIMSITTSRGRSTVELSADLRTVFQHRGERNAEPPEQHRLLLQHWRRKHGLEASSRDGRAA